MLGVLALVLAGVAIVGGLYLSADIVPPASERNFSVERRDSCGVIRYGESTLRHSRNGLWEMFLKGDADERGDAFGAMADSLIDHQERIFIRQIREIVPDEHYLRFLNVLTQVFNRHITRHIPEEYCREIARMSEHCSYEYDFIGTPYLRQLNYHAAYDIGHAMQDYMLVGCTGLAAWGESSEEGMIVGRNFDFWVGDEFASNRLLTFYRPERRYGFVSVGWPGMVGVLSGMNERGLTITLHAAKGELPLQSATPVSVLAREILQYASSVEEAVKIASRRKLFVSECFFRNKVKDCYHCRNILRTIQRTQIEQRRLLYKKLKEDKNYSDVHFDKKTGGLMAIHKDHNFDPRKGWYEKEVQKAGYDTGHCVILEPEDHTQYKVKNVEGLWNGLQFEIAGAETGTPSNIRNALKHCARKLADIAVVYFPN